MKYGPILSDGKFRTRVEGFTLIEMIVAVTLMMVLLGLTISGYTSYNSKQNIKQAALTLKSNLRTARTNAMSGKKPLECTEEGETLAGYEVSFTVSSYTITPQCSSTDPVTEGVVHVQLPPGIVFSEVPSPFMYSPLTQGFSGTLPLTIELTDDTNSVTLVIDSTTGDVSDLPL